jgi:hypothetical protein
VARIRNLFAGGSDGNARLTAATAAVLSLLLILEGFTLLGGVRRLLVPHIFIGLLLIPPILLKLASTSWRMVSYYRRAEEYVRRGPPHALLRFVVSPLLVMSTVVLFASGIAAAWSGHRGLLLGLHKASFVVWAGTFGVHFLAHVVKLPQLVAFDWWKRDRLGGRRLRQYLLAATLVVGLVAASAAFPLAHHWHPALEFADGG